MHAFFFILGRSTKGADKPCLETGAKKVLQKNAVATHPAGKDEHDGGGVLTIEPAGRLA